MVKNQNETKHDILKTFKTNEGLARFICRYANKGCKNNSTKYIYSKAKDVIYITKSKSSHPIVPNEYWMCLSVFMVLENITTSDELRIWIDLNMYEHKDEFNLVE